MRKFVWILLGGLMIATVYYLFIRSFEFEVTFKTKTTPGDIIESIRIWDRSLKTSNEVVVDSFSSLSQTIVWKNRNYEYNWHFSSYNDSTTKVNVKISEPGRSFVNKILIPFSEQPIEIDANEIVRTFYDVLKEHLNITRVRVIGEAEIDSAFCVCSSLKAIQIEKANGMMNDFPLLTTFITNLKLKPNGLPMVRITEWNHSKGLIKFDFCFPIVRQDSLPALDSISYKSFKREKVLKAEFNGNYITSDRAWYALIQFAERNGYEVSGLPIEYFHDNPNLGNNELRWKADVFLPIRE
jgi:effector-binding domain-containing protein